MEPQSAFYNSPLVVLDFQSLYPSIMVGSLSTGLPRDGDAIVQTGISKLLLFSENTVLGAGVDLETQMIGF